MLRCQEASQHLRNADETGAIGALAGVEDKVRYVTTVLAALRDAQATLVQTPIPFEEKGGSPNE